MATPSGFRQAEKSLRTSKGLSSEQRVFLPVECYAPRRGAQSERRQDKALPRVGRSGAILEMVFSVPQAIQWAFMRIHAVNRVYSPAPEP